MNIGVYINQPGVKSNNKLFFKYTNLVDFFSNFSVDNQISRIDICIPLSTKPVKNAKCLLHGYNERKTTFIGIPYYEGPIDLGKKFYKIFPMSIIRAISLAKKNEIIGAPMPSLIGLVFCIIGRIYHRKLFLIVRGDKTKSSLSMRNKFFAKIYLLIINMINSLTLKFFSNELIVVLGKDLAKKYRKYCSNVHVLGAQIPDELFKQTFISIPPKNEDSINILYVGRLAAEKNIGFLIKAISKIKSKFDLKLIIIGEGPERAYLEKLVEKLDLMKTVVFKGHIPHSESLFVEYKKANFFILPSLSEGVPRSILEAMSLKVPVITTNVGGIPTVIKHNETGLLIEPNDEDSLLKYIEIIINDEVLRKKIISNASKVAQEYSFTVLKGKMIEKIKSI